MPARTGKQYLAGLREQEREVWLEGERVKDPTAHRGLRNGARALLTQVPLVHVVMEFAPVAHPLRRRAIDRQFAQVLRIHPGRTFPHLFEIGVDTVDFDLADDPAIAIGLGPLDHDRLPE